jgi:hypothetical protein
LPQDTWDIVSRPALECSAYNTQTNCLIGFLISG